MPLYRFPNFRQLPPGLCLAFESCTDKSFFSLPQWYDLFTRLALPQESEVRIYTDERRESATALLLYGATVAERRCLTSLANVYSVEHGPLCSQTPDLTRAVASILEEIVGDRPHWDCLRLTELDPQAPFFQILLKELRQAGFMVECTPGAATWFEVTIGMDFADYIAQRPSQLRNTWRRKRRAIQSAGTLTALFLSDETALDQAIIDYEKIYAASWKPAEAFPGFIPALIRLAWSLGALRLGIYYLNGIPAAAQFWIVWQGRAAIYKLAHDQRFDALSLGTLLTMDMIERVLNQDRPSEINFGRGNDPYKQSWLPRRRERWGITAANPRTIRGLRLGLEREAAKLYHRLRGEPIGPLRTQAFSHKEP